MIKGAFYILFFTVNILCCSTINAQNVNLTNERTFSYLYDIVADTSVNFHSSIKPYSKNEMTNYDSILNQLNIQSKRKFLNTLCNYSSLNTEKGKGFIFIAPIIDAGITLEKSSTLSQNLISQSYGLKLSSAWSKKWSSQIAVLSDYSKYASYIDNQIEVKNISPGYGYSKNNQAFFGQGNITFTADKNFTLQAGYGKNFIGDGYRSLFLSDNANSYPYFKVTANVWKFKYLALYSMHQDIRDSGGKIGNYFTKYATTHYLSYNATKWLNFGFFESIVFQAQEGNFYRGFDINYLNPVLFLRPVEFAQGSADNALLGGSLKLRIKKKNIIYGQVLLDEFLLKELKAQNGWWGNKYGIQIGLKSYDFLWIKNFRLQLEYNMVRPFTYSYFYQPTSISTLQNYGHFNASLAHPLGANFKEVFAGLSYRKKRWIIEAQTTYAKIGLDTSLTSTIGQDIYKPYNDRETEYGYEIGNGVSTKIINSTFKVSYLINATAKFTFYTGVSNRSYKNNYTNSSSNYFFIGLKTNITNRYFDF